MKGNLPAITPTTNGPKKLEDLSRKKKATVRKGEEKKSGFRVGREAENVLNLSVMLYSAYHLASCPGGISSAYTDRAYDWKAP
jgi:hypothetical protein